MSLTRLMVMDEPRSRLQSASVEHNPEAGSEGDEEVEGESNMKKIKEMLKENMTNEQEEKKKQQILQIKPNRNDGTSESDDGGVIIPEELRTPLLASRPHTPAELAAQDMSKTPLNNIVNTNVYINTPDIPLPPDMLDPFTETSPPTPKEIPNSNLTITPALSKIPALAHPSSRLRTTSPTKPSKIPKMTRNSSPPKKIFSPAKSITPATSTASLSLTLGGATAVSTEDSKSAHGVLDAETPVASNAEETGK